jgi:hypothetical protein
LTATGVTLAIALNWTNVAGATSFNIYRSTSPGTETLFLSGVTTNSFVDSPLPAGQVFFYQVTAVNGAGESGKSNEASAAALGIPTGGAGGGIPGWGTPPVGAVWFRPVPDWIRRLYGVIAEGRGDLVFPATITDGRQSPPEWRHRETPIPEFAAVPDLTKWLREAVAVEKRATAARLRRHRIRVDDEMILMN